MTLIKPPEQRVVLEAARTRYERFARDIGAWLAHDDSDAGQSFGRSVCALPERDPATSFWV